MTAPWGLGHMHLLPIACQFLNAYRDIGLRLVLSDRVLRPLEDNIDVAIRIGTLPDSNMIATHVGSVRVVSCACPTYLAARGHPETPNDLCRHDCVAVDDVVAPRTWKFASGRREIAAPIRSKLTVNTSEAAVEAAVAGAGIARVMSYKMEAARRAGALVTVLEAFEQEPLPMHVVYPERRPVPLKLRVFLNWAIPRLKARLS